MLLHAHRAISTGRRNVTRHPVIQVVNKCRGPYAHYQCLYIVSLCRGITGLIHYLTWVWKFDHIKTRLPAVWCCPFGDIQQMLFILCSKWQPIFLLCVFLLKPPKGIMRAPYSVPDSCLSCERKGEGWFTYSAFISSDASWSWDSKLFGFGFSQMSSSLRDGNELLLFLLLWISFSVI